MSRILRDNAKRTFLILAVWVCLGHYVDEPVEGAKGPLRVCEQNRRYFSDGERVVYLTGSHTWNNLVDMSKADPPQKFDFDGYLGWMQKLNHNFVRLWAWEPVTWNTKNNRRDAINNVYPQPWVRTGKGKALDGKGKFDLTKYDAEYFCRLRRRVEEANKRDIYVSIMLFEGWAMQFSPGAWEGHPFNAKNNVNGIDGDANGDGKGLEIHEPGSEAVLKIQQAYVRKVIDMVNDLDNVLYEISNENHPPSTKWQYEMIRFIKDYESKKPKQHPVGMTFQYKGGDNKTLFGSLADWISPNHDNGRYRSNPPVADGRKVVLLDTDHLWGIGGDQAWVWKSFTRGHNPIFMDPYDGLILGEKSDPKWPPIRKSLGYTRRYADRMDLAKATPQPNLSSTKYCLANPGVEYLIYRPAGTPEEVTVKMAAGEYSTEWFDPSRGVGEAPHKLKMSEGDYIFKPAIDGDAVLYLKRID